MELTDYQEVATLIKVAMSAGGRRVSPTTFEWDVSNGCENPVVMTKTGRPPAEDGEKYIEIVPRHKHLKGESVFATRDDLDIFLAVLCRGPSRLCHDDGVLTSVRYVPLECSGTNTSPPG